MILFLILLFFLYYFIKYNNKKENFLDRKNSSLTKCIDINEKINLYYDVFLQRKISYSNAKHKQFGIMRPILFFFWDNDNEASKNFKNNEFTIDDTSMDSCDEIILDQLKYLGTTFGQSPYGKIRYNLEKIYLPLIDGNSLFKCDNLHRSKADIKDNNFYLFKQTYPDFIGNELTKEFYFENDYKSREEIWESSEDYNDRSNNLRILDFDLNCYNSDKTAQFCGFQPNSFNRKVDNITSECCFNSTTSNNNGLVLHNSPSGSNSCCKNTTGLAFIPESSLILKFIYHAKIEFLENREYYGYNDYNIDNNILSSDIEKDTYNGKGIISHCPELVLWDGFGIYVKKDTTDNNYYVYIINEDPNVPTLDGDERTKGDDLKIPVYDISEYRNKDIFKNFIKNHFYVYRKVGLNFFEYMCLEFKKIAGSKGGELIDQGMETKKYLVKNNKITDYGFGVIKELYKYHVKAETNFDSLVGDSPLYKDLHLDYFTLTKWYGNNNCQYNDYKLFYEMENINFDWSVCDIMRFVIHTLYLPYKVMTPNNKCELKSDNDNKCWADKLIGFYSNSSKFNCVK